MSPDAALALRPPPSSRIAVAVSGGVDSLCALALLKESGHDVFAIHGQFLPDSICPPRLRDICAGLKIDLLVADLHEEFARQVITPFCRAYENGLTPNPCAWCNKKIKFGALLEIAVAHGAEFLATGHYAALANNPYEQDGGVILAAPMDSRKDQTYFLSLLSQAQLRKAVFPLANLTKAQCRQILAERGIEAPVSAESQDICFNSGGEYAQLLGRGLTPGPIRLAERHGQILAAGRVVGEHCGLARYTIGQRRGLGVAHTEPLYVLRRDMRENTLLVGPASLLGQKSVAIRPVSLHIHPRVWPERLFARLRYRAAAIPCVARFEGELTRLDLGGRRFPAASGQIGTILDERGHVLAGGVII